MPSIPSQHPPPEQANAPTSPEPTAWVTGLFRARAAERAAILGVPAGYALDKQIAALDEHAIVSVADLGGRITYVNDRFCQVSGYARDELLGQNHRVLKSGRHPDPFYAGMWSNLRDGQPWHGVICNRRKDGSYYWVQSTILPLQDAAGDVTEYVSIRTDITGLKEAEERLRLYERAFAASTSGIVMVDACDGDYPLVNVSPSFEALTGYGAAELLGRNCRYMLGADDQQPEMAALRAALAQGRPAQALVRNYRKDGSRYYAAVRMSPVHDDTGMLTHYVAIVDDTTELREAQMRLLDSGERMRLSQRFANIATWEWDPATGQVLGSERLGPLLGLPVRDDFTTAQVRDALHPDDVAAVRDRVVASQSNGAPFELECRCQWPDGTEHWLLTRGEAVPQPGRRRWRVVGVVQEVTRRKVAEIALARSQARLMEAQRLARLGHWELDLASRQMYWCERIFELLDLEPATTDTSLAALREVVHPDDRAAFDLWLQRAVRDGHAELTHRCAWRDHQVRHLQQRARLDASGRLVGTMQDVTERMQQQDELRSAMEAAEQASAAKSTFLSSMSHELRTPMNAILGFAQLLELDDRLDASQHDQVDEILEAGRHLLSLIDEVLDLARVESGRIDLSPAAVPLAELVQECSGWAATLDAARDIEFNTSLPAGLCAWADRRRLKQVLVNLLTNAVKYNRRPGWVAVEARPSAPDRVRLTVRDGGLGMNPQQLGQLFQPFTRLHAQHADGTGVGLSLTKRLVETMGGTIGVSSRPDMGTEFWIDLPGATAPAPTPSPTPAPHTAPSHDRAAAASQLSVLYIEDHPGNLTFMQEVLALRPGLNLVMASDGPTGLEMARRLRPDLVLVDINMPGMDGFGVLAALRADPTLRATRVVALSAAAMRSDVDRGLAAGFDDYLIKPVHVATLLGRLDAWIPT